jgi:hypothetical protein
MEVTVEQVSVHNAAPASSVSVTDAAALRDRADDVVKAAADAGVELSSDDLLIWLAKRMNVTSLSMLRADQMAVAMGHLDHRYAEMIKAAVDGRSAP